MKKYLYASGVMFLGALSFNVAWCKPLVPSELNTHLASYKNQTVTVKGYVILNPEGHISYES